ncbi:MAG: metallophosphoesterase, partial [Planctomycetota bacterium]
MLYAQDETPNLIHDRHDHAHNPAHETVQPTDSRFYTTRRSDIVLPLPSEESAFVFAVFGDRTGGPDEGINVLADAVRDVNLLEPDLVMTVGDLIQGYGQSEAWLEEMTEYKAIMDKLLCPWFPVAGNHDVYWRGPNRPEGEHEANYEMHFGPLWYSFQHKNANFIVLYTDEGNPDTGAKSFRDPENQRMSTEQYDFLQQAIIRGKNLDHQFVFVHHPRWLEGGYGTDWNDKVHPLLTEVGNVTAVFAGHIHRMRTDPKDGIQYVTLATVGGHQSSTIPDAGFLHHYNLITVRKDQVAMAAIPVGEVLDVRELTGELQEECVELARLAPEVEGILSLESNGSAADEFIVKLSNPTSRPVDFTLATESFDRRWFMSPDHIHGTLASESSKSLRFRVARDTGPIDDAFDGVRFALYREYLAPGFRYEIPTTHTSLPLSIQAIDLEAYSSPRVLVLDGEGQAVKVPSGVASIQSGHFTIEGWINAEEFS